MKADLFSLIIYWGALFISLLFCYEYNNRKSKSLGAKIFFVTLICLPLSIVAGLRYNVGTDYEFYNSFFLKYGNYDIAYILNSSTHFETGFLLLTKLCYFLFGNSSFFYFFIIEFLSLFIAVWAFMLFSNKINLVLSFFLYYILFFHFSLNGIRSSIAISFLILSYYYLLNGKWLKYYLVLLGGFFFHKTIIICALYPIVLLFSGKFVSNRFYIRRTKNTIGYILLMIIMVYLLGFILADSVHLFFGDKYQRYMEEGEQNLGLGTIFFFVMYMVPFLISNWKVIRTVRDYARLRDLALFYLPVSFIGFYVSWGERINLFSEVAFLYMFALTANDKSINKWSKYYSIGWCVLVYVYTILISNFNNTFPYRIG